MRICLFDWTSGGHHAIYLRRFCMALAPDAEVVVAAPDSMLDDLDDLPVELLPLGPARPRENPDEPPAQQRRTFAHAELDLLARATRESGADHVVHLHVDPVMRELVRRRRLPAKLTIVSFFARIPRGVTSRLRSPVSALRLGQPLLRFPQQLARRDRLQHHLGTAGSRASFARRIVVLTRQRDGCLGVHAVIRERPRDVESVAVREPQVEQQQVRRVR